MRTSDIMAWPAARPSQRWMLRRTFGERCWHRRASSDLLQGLPPVALARMRTSHLRINVDSDLTLSVCLGFKYVFTYTYIYIYIEPDIVCVYIYIYVQNTGQCSIGGICFSPAGD